MAGYKTNRIIPIALVLIIAVLAIAALISIARVLFFSGGSTAPTTADVSESTLLSTDTGHAVRMTVRGPIVASEDSRSYQITITPNSRNLTVYKGYLGDAIKTINLDNNIPAYTQFVYALDRANLVKGTQWSGTKNDTRGVCATGELYDFTVLDGSQSVKDLWTSTCSGSTGSLDASVDQLTNLFTTQIPGSTDAINDANL